MEKYKKYFLLKLKNIILITKFSTSWVFKNSLADQRLNKDTKVFSSQGSAANSPNNKRRHAIRKFKFRLEEIKRKDPM